jgi:hypothetical protein
MASSGASRLVSACSTLTHTDVHRDRIALAALAVAIAFWFRPAPEPQVQAAPTFTEAEVAKVKQKTGASRLWRRLAKLPWPETVNSHRCKRRYD